MICIIFGWRCQGGSWRKVVYVIIIKIPTRQCFLDNDSTSHVEHPTMVLFVVFQQCDSISERPTSCRDRYYTEPTFILRCNEKLRCSFVVGSLAFPKKNIINKRIIRTIYSWSYQSDIVLKSVVSWKIKITWPTIIRDNHVCIFRT
jgi:hypothetical protein